jgi:hypothetical protein
MPRPSRTIPGVLACVLLVLSTGCTAEAAVREPGSAVTEDEAEALSRLLLRNYQRGGADFVVTAPYAPDVVLTLTGEVDFRRSQGRAQLVTSYGDDRPDGTAAIWFSTEALWVGDDPGLASALAEADATYLRRPLDVEGRADLVDVLVHVVLGLSRARTDEPRAFLDGDWTWQGQRSIDSRLATLFGAPGGRTVAVDASDDVLTQSVTTVADAGFDVTITLSDHGMRRIDLPAEDETAEAAEHADVAAALGI